VFYGDEDFIIPKCGIPGCTCHESLIRRYFYSNDPSELIATAL
jgi:hypothetical protein